MKTLITIGLTVSLVAAFLVGGGMKIMVDQAQASHVVKVNNTCKNFPNLNICK